jgi:hypothetical protein
VGANAQFLGGGQSASTTSSQNGIIVGAEAMFDWLLSSQNAIITTVSGRLGYAWDRVLLCAKGGDDEHSTGELHQHYEFRLHRRVRRRVGRLPAIGRYAVAVYRTARHT